MPDFDAYVRRNIRPLSIAGEREQAIVEELAGHLEDAWDACMRRGMSQAQAWEELERSQSSWPQLRQALLAGEPARMRETRSFVVRRGTAGMLVEQFWQDVRHALRQMRLAPAFTALAVVTLALGLGATSAMYTVVYSVLLSPLPIAEPDRVVRLAGVNSMPNIRDVREQAQSLTAIQAYRSVTWTLTGDGEAQSLGGGAVEAGLFDLLGVRPLLGRTFAPGEDTAEAAPVVILSEGLWQQRFGADPGVLGRSITLNQRQYTVIGVMPRTFRFPLGSAFARFYVPLLPDPVWDDQRGYNFFANLARLAPEATLESANAELAGIARRLTERWYPNSPRGLSMTATPISEFVSGAVRPTLLTMFGAVVLVLLITCVNVSNLLLARFTTRRQSVLVRVALGAERARIVRQFLTESLLLAAAGAAVGLLIAVAAVRVLSAIEQLRLPRIDELSLDGPVFAFAAAVMLLTALVCGLVPALRATRMPSDGGLRLEPTRSVAGTRRPLTALLVGAQVALALMLLAGAGLLVRSWLELRAVNPGFEADNALAVQVTLPANSDDPYLAAQRFMTPVRDEVLALPGVANAGWVTALPLQASFVSGAFELVDRELPPGVTRNAVYQDVGADYFAALGIPITRGRAVAGDDVRGGLPVVVVDEAFVDQYFGPDASVVGTQITDVVGTTLTIVGVAGNVRQRSLGEEPSPHIYRALEQVARPPPLGQIILAIRTRTEPEQLVAAVRAAFARVAPDVAIADARTMQQVVADSVTDRSFNTALLSLFAVVGLVLVATGIYGVLSFAVAQRRQEICVRMALGASARSVVAMVVGASLKTVAAGIALGLAGALLAARLLQSMLYEVSAHDAMTLTVVSVLILAVALLASWLPARRAASADPAGVLRHD